MPSIPIATIVLILLSLAASVVVVVIIVLVTPVLVGCRRFRVLQGLGTGRELRHELRRSKMRDGHGSAITNAPARIEDRLRTDQILLHNLSVNRRAEVVRIDECDANVCLRSGSNFAHVAEWLGCLARCILHIFRNLLLWARDHLLQTDGSDDAVDQVLVLLRARRTIGAGKLEFDGGLSLERRTELRRDVHGLHSQLYLVVEQQLVWQVQGF